MALFDPFSTLFDHVKKCPTFYLGHEGDSSQKGVPPESRRTWGSGGRFIDLPIRMFRDEALVYKPLLDRKSRFYRDFLLQKCLKTSWLPGLEKSEKT